MLISLGIKLYDPSGERVQRTPRLLSGTEHVADKRSFKHFMLKEIHEQPETAALWVARIQRWPVAPAAIPLRWGRICWSSSLGFPAGVFYASDFRYTPPPLSANTLMIGVAQSGVTADTLAALAMEQERRQLVADPEYAPRLLGITNSPESSLGRLQALVAGLKAVPEQLRALVAEHDRRSEELEHRFESTQDVIFLGRGINYPIALERALKLKEISYIHAEGYPAAKIMFPIAPD